MRKKHFKMSIKVFVMLCLLCSIFNLNSIQKVSANAGFTFFNDVVIPEARISATNGARVSLTIRPTILNSLSYDSTNKVMNFTTSNEGQIIGYHNGPDIGKARIDFLFFNDNEYIGSYTTESYKKNVEFFPNNMQLKTESAGVSKVPNRIQLRISVSEVSSDVEMNRNSETVFDAPLVPYTLTNSIDKFTELTVSNVDVNGRDFNMYIDNNNTVFLGYLLRGSGRTQEIGKVVLDTNTYNYYYKIFDKNYKVMLNPQQSNFNFYNDGSGYRSTGFKFDISQGHPEGSKLQLFRQAKNYIPSIALSTPNNQIISDKAGYNILTIVGSVKDGNVNDTLQIKYQIDGGPAQVIQTLVANATYQSLNAYNIAIPTTLSNGLHELKVWAEDQKGGVSNIESRSFSYDNMAPSGPSLSVWNKSENSIALTWDSTDASGISRFEIYQGSTLLGTTQSTTYVVNGLTPSTAYQFTVKAWDVVGNMSTSNVLNVTTPDITPPSVPGNLRATNINATGVDLVWDRSTDNVGVVSYEIYNDNQWIASTDNNSYRFSWGTAALKSVTDAVYHSPSALNIDDRESEEVKSTNHAMNISATQAVYMPQEKVAALGISYNFTVRAKDAAGNLSAPSNAVMVEKTDGNDTPSTATLIGYKQAVSTFIDQASDVDYFTFNAKSTGIHQIILEVPATKNYDVRIYDHNMKVLAGGVGGMGEAEEVLFKANAGQVYYIKVYGVNGDFSNELYSLMLNLYINQYQTDYEYDRNGNLKKKVTKFIP